MKNKKPVSFAEEGCGRTQIKIGDRTHHQDVSEKIGADGVIETHISYTKTERAYYGRPKGTYCGSCDTWIVKDYKYVGHKKGCKTQ